MEDNIYYKQKKLFDPSLSQLKINVYGCGSIGSHVIMGLAKTGFEDITVYDYDKVEADNLPAQFFSGDSIGKNKVDAMQELVYLFTNNSIDIKNEKITEDSTIDLGMNSIHIIAFDSIESRKVILEHLKGFPLYVIDGRIGAFNYEKYSFKADDDKAVTEYESTLNGRFSELECGEKCLWSVNSMLASKIIADVIMLHKQQQTKSCMKSNLMSDFVISKD